VAQIWTVLATAIFYGAPILYGIETVASQPKLQTVINWNPLSPLLEQARVWIVDPSAPNALEAVGNQWTKLLIPAGIALVVCVFALWSFNREAPRIAEEL